MDLSDLYQEIILDHGRKPRNHREMPDATHCAEGYNPLCGDQIKVWVRVEDDKVTDASFTGHGCAISQASASMMTQAVKGQSVEHAQELFDAFRKSVMIGSDESDKSNTSDNTLGDLNCLTGVRKYPNRIKCATLAWHAMHSALEGQGVVSTE